MGGLNTRLGISSSPRYNIYGTDFGWGKPIGVRSGMANKSDGKITLFPGVGGSVDIEVCILPETLQAMENDQEFMEAGECEDGLKAWTSLAIYCLSSVYYDPLDIYRERLIADFFILSLMGVSIDEWKYNVGVENGRLGGGGKKGRVGDCPSSRITLLDLEHRDTGINSYHREHMIYSASQSTSFDAQIAMS
ncbi:hypothetical protein RND71_023479 [Anisodus tanguticus]|uniref:Uncharacterized protein n=1 Tax=Anisodus tanguticus TaxID=243964 RepID=A0AAE1RSN9_9SOLA|nr:hypothetical protein RND71_023479 [Anisodus tanguticus]